MNKWIIVFIFFFIALFMAILMMIFGTELHLETTTEKWVVGTSVTLVVYFLIFILAFIPNFWLGRFKNFAKRQKLNPQDEEKVDSDKFKLSDDNWRELKQRSKFNRLTRQKPWLGVLGDVSLLKKTFHNWESKYWIETEEAFWINLSQGIPKYKRWGKAPLDALLPIYAYENWKDEQVADLSRFIQNIQWNIPIYRIGLDKSREAHHCEFVLSYNLENISKFETIPETWTQPLQAQATYSLENNIYSDFLMRLLNFFKYDNQEIINYVKLSSYSFLMQRWLVLSCDPQNLAKYIRESMGIIIPKSYRQSLSYWDKICWAVCAGSLSILMVILYAFTQTQNNINILEKQLTSFKSAYSSDSKQNQFFIQKILEQQLFIQNLEQNNNFLSSFELNKTNQLLSLSKEAYRKAIQILLDPILTQVTNELEKLNKGTVKSSSDEQIFFNVFKAYLMLTMHPEKSENPFLNDFLLKYATTVGYSQDSIHPILTFYSEHLIDNHSWKLKNNAELTGKSRRTLSNWISIIQADEHAYRKIIADGIIKYPDLSLADLIHKDYRGVWNSNSKLPGVYTEEAWNNYIKPAFESAGKSKKVDSVDWVLSGDNQNTLQSITEEKLKKRYFKNYQEVWYRFLNGISWEEQKSVQDIATQLHLYTSPQNSPLLALFAVISQNSHPGEQQVGLVDSLAQSLKKQVSAVTGRHTPQVVKSVTKEGFQQASQATDAQLEELKKNFASPVKNAFLPLTQLVDPKQNPNNELSLQRYLEKVSSSEQKLVQINSSNQPDDVAKQVMHSFLANNSNEFTEGDRYAKLIKSTLGDDLAPFAQQVFVKPFVMSWNSLVAPAQNNINELWRKSILDAWHNDFSGRYPFVINDSEVSIPMLTKYLEPQQGLIDLFIQQQLSGIVVKQGDQWVASSEQIMHISPNFLNKINHLKTISQDLFFKGDMGYFFELKPIPTTQLVQYNLIIDDQKLEYFNQKPQWQNFKWPGDILKAGTRITWETEEGGMRQTLELNGRWGFIRLLEQAKISQVDKSTYLIEWKLANKHNVRFYMRTVSGRGPMALLDLKTFSLPEKVFDQYKTEHVNNKNSPVKSSRKKK